MVFLFEFIMCGKAVEITHNINTFGPVMLMNVQCSGDSRRFAKEMRPLKIRPAIEVYKKQLRGSLKPILLQLLKKLPKNSMLTILWSFAI